MADFLQQVVWFGNQEFHAAGAAERRQSKCSDAAALVAPLLPTPLSMRGETNLF
jgi:hypothetical protein